MKTDARSLNPRSQAPGTASSKRQDRLRSLRSPFWNLVIPVSLGFGFWCLEFPQRSFGQGSLTPPAAPAETMKSLDQIRSTGTPLNQTTAPGDASYHFIISAPGSYFLTGNLDLTTTLNGIRVTADNVTIDLNGFQVGRASAGGGTAIQCDAANCQISNGTITGVNDAVFAPNGPSVLTNLTVTNTAGGTAVFVVKSSVVSFCRFSANTNTVAILNASDSTVHHCIVANNLTQAEAIKAQGGTVRDCDVLNNGDNSHELGAGIRADRVIDCTVTGNTMRYGISTPSFVNRCVVTKNFSKATDSAGIYCHSDDAVVANCNVSININSTPTADGHSGAGVRVTAGFYGGSITGCTIDANTGDGITVVDRSLISGNMLDGNGGAGIHAEGSSNRIEGNNITNNAPGIRVDAAANLIISNSARGNTGGNYNILAGNRIGEIITPATSSASGNTGGVAFSGNSWANIAY